MKNIKKIRKFSSFQIITVGFFLTILAGALLLMLPIATRGPGGTGFLNALFTSTSAVCVTGLVVYDTATHWTAFGQLIILILIQIGGMGVITVAVSIAMFAGRKIGLFQRSTMQEALATHTVGGVVRLTGFIIKVTAIIEVLGAVLMAPVFCKSVGVAKGIWYAIFHSVSAFCNAGFDLMGCHSPCSSLTEFVGNPLINIVIMCLIIIGGLGFLTWDDVRVHRFHFTKYRLQSKLIFLVTIVLIVLPTIYFYFYEFSMATWENLSFSERILASLFQAVTPRTAGFNTIDMSMYTEQGQLITIILMLIGGSPGSTAGGMKTTTIAVLLFSAFSVFKKKEDANCFGRRISDQTVKNASAILMMYLVLFITGGLVISAIEGIPILVALFETSSAIATVGLSLGITAQVGTISKLILILLMYFGRVGGLTLILAAVSNIQSARSRFPKEKVTVG